MKSLISTNRRLYLMPRRSKDKGELPDIDWTEIDDPDELEEYWQEYFEEDFSGLDDFDDLQDWLDHEDSWSEDKYKES
jgi:hypothetical protein